MTNLAFWLARHQQKNPKWTMTNRHVTVCLLKSERKETSRQTRHQPLREIVLLKLKRTPEAPIFQREDVMLSDLQVSTIGDFRSKESYILLHKLIFLLTVIVTGARGKL